MSHYFLFFILFVATSCSFFSKRSYDVFSTKKKNFSLVFGHNINGETHPCGCRHHPLGGIPQIAGLLSEIRSQNETIYIDTGDTLFSGTNIPDTVKESVVFNAKALIKFQDELGLAYHLPGDQDFAFGLDYFREMILNRKSSLLISNLNEKANLPHKKWAVIENGAHRIYLMAILSKEDIYFSPNFPLEILDSKEESIRSVLKTLKEHGYQPENSFHRLVLLSHSGMGPDEKLAKVFPEIDWIIGAHSQSFTLNPLLVGKTKIVQVLSRNHYLGEIRFSLSKDKSEDTFSLHEIRDDLKEKLSPNPFIASLEEHKKSLNEIQLKEQNKLFNNFVTSEHRMPKPTTCLDCHKSQVEKWESTPHSLAYITLLKNSGNHNKECLACHTWGQGEGQGFQNSKEVVLSGDEKAAATEDYWREVSSIFKNIHKVRELSSEKIVKLNRSWNELDQKKNIQHKFTNVQCLNCHKLHIDHPFGPSIKSSYSYEEKKYKRIDFCVQCHNKDQSPEWYTSEGLNKHKILDLVEKIACPHHQESDQ